MTPCRVLVVRAGTGLWNYLLLDAEGRETWPLRFEWNQHNSFFRTPLATVERAQERFPGLPVELCSCCESPGRFHRVAS
jgi:hypothetical protein